jgi:16S rRNA (cytosine967-C5)-methyltransferase
MKSKNVREVALEALLAIEKNQAYSNLLLNKMIEKYQLSSKDVGLLTEMVYGTIQRRDTLDYYLRPFLKKANKLEVWVKVLLRLSLYQMLYLDRVPDRAAIYEAVEIAKRRGHKGIASMVNGVLRAIQREGVPSLEEIADRVERLAVETSHPLWLVRRWVEQFGFEEARKMCETNLLPPEQTARINISRITVNEAIDRLREEGIEVTCGNVVPEAVKSKKGNLAHTTTYKEGYLTIQDESSMLVAKALGVKENERVLDSCAAPGGKSTHIAELMYNTGQVISLDIHDHKIKLIQEQAERLKLHNIDAQVLDSRKVMERFAEETFDKILVDAPCSGFGVLRRKPDIKYAKKENDIFELSKVQRDILEAVAPLLKKGGTLVYSTCTIDEEENEKIIEEFLRRHPEFEMDETMGERLPEKVKPYVKNGQLQILPHYFGTDGFFIAALRKKV